MPIIQAFRGLRYELGHVGSLSDVIAPPYDVIDDDLRDQLYQRHPANVVRLILNREEPGDDFESNRYTRAARFLRNWRSEGLLVPEADPAIYAYHQEFLYEGRELIRRGFMCRMRLQRFGEGNVYPHEETYAAPKLDRLKLMRACRANLSPVFGLYADPTNDVQERLEAAIAGQTPLEAKDHLGIVHRMWPVTDVKAIADVSGLVSPRPVFIADGHHRYETACTYRDELASEMPLRDEHPAHYVLMMLVSMSDPGMVVLPTHRLFRGLPQIDARQLAARLDPSFETHAVAQGPQMANSVWQKIMQCGEQSMLGLFTWHDQQWTVARLTDHGRQQMARLAPEHTPDWRSLGVSILHRLVVERLSDSAQLPPPIYVHLVDELVQWLERGDEFGQPFPLAALVMPASVEHIRTISQHGERMPAKSTYFFPKLLSGLVINPHE